MLTDFQKKKLTYFFGLYDLNKNGFLQLEDFTDISERLCAELSYDPGTKEHEFLVRRTVALFHKLLNDIPHPDRHHILLEEWLSFFEKVVLSSDHEDELEEYVDLIMGYLFDLFDENHDGYISIEEYRQVFQVYGIDLNYVNQAFDNLDLNKDEKLSRNELFHAVETFLLSDDPEEKGNWIFGDWNQIIS